MEDQSSSTAMADNGGTLIDPAPSIHNLPSVELSSTAMPANNNIPGQKHARTLTPQQQQELNEHNKLLSGRDNSHVADTRRTERKTAPIVSGAVLTSFPRDFSQYGLLAEHYAEDPDSRLLLNVTPPWSGFICGSQGSGKSHTLSCILENSLYRSSASNVTKPLAGIVFHWDRFTSYGSKQICEAAYLCSAGIPINVLVSPSNLKSMEDAYSNIPVRGKNGKKPVVVPMYFDESQLDVTKMMTIMGLRGKEDELPLYMQVVIRILREMARDQQRLDSRARQGINYKKFLHKIEQEENLNPGQTGPLKLRLDNLGSFMREMKPDEDSDSPTLIPPPAPPAQQSKTKQKQTGKPLQPLEKLNERKDRSLTETWAFEAGGLTIVDLSCPFVDENFACALFTICLQLFLERRGDVGLIVALDEAHKFLTGSTGANAFTAELLYLIRQQRHFATRVLIATQEPTLSPQLLELCTFTIVHRFSSPNWFKALQGHLAGLSDLNNIADTDEDESARELGQKRAITRLFKEIVNLETGEGLLFSATAMTGVEVDVRGRPIRSTKLGARYFKIRTRQRLTTDGGQSIMAE